MEKNKQQTAVEWFAKKVMHLDWKFSNQKEKEKIIQQAKEMGKERIENAFNSGYNNGGLDTCLTPKQYYEQTYGGGEQ
jgi:hypothetical protein